MKQSLLGLLFCFALGLATPALAQTQPSEQERAMAFQQLFDAGMDAMTKNELDRSIMIFQRCIQLYPDRPTAYYNIACALSRQNKVAPCLKYLEESFKRGFESFEHITRDPDLVNVRKDERFAKLVAKYKAKFSDKLNGFFYKPESNGKKLPLIVFLHGRGQSLSALEKQMVSLADRLNVAVLLPRGDSALGRGMYGWGQGGETVVMNLVRKHSVDPEIDTSKIIVGGYATGSYQAFEVALENPKLFRGIFAVTPVFDEENLAKKISGAKENKLSVFMVVGQNEALRQLATKTRNAFVTGGVPTVLRMVPTNEPMSSKFEKQMLRTVQEAIQFSFKGKTPAKGQAKAF